MQRNAKSLCLKLAAVVLISMCFGAAIVKAQVPIDDQFRMVYGFDDSAPMYNVLEVKMDNVLRYNDTGTAIDCPVVLDDGKPQPPSFACKLQRASNATMTATISIGGTGQGRLPRGSYMIGQLLTLDAVSIQSKKDKDLLEFRVMDFTRTAVGAAAPPTTHAAIVFQFPKGFLETASFNQAMQAVSKVLIPRKVPRTIRPETIAAANGAPAQPPPPSNRSTPNTAPPPAMNTVPLPTVAAAPQALDAQLKTLYTLTQLGPNSAVQTQGSILSVTKPNTLLGTPIAKPNTCPASFSGGAAKPPAADCLAPLKPAIAKHDVAYLPSGQKVSIISITVDVSKETVVFGLIDNTPGAAPHWRTAVNFVFPAGYLEAADAGQIADTVNSLLLMS